MKHLIYTGFYVLVLLTVSGCEREIKVNLPPYKEKLVLNCAFNNLDPMSLDVSQSRGILSAADTFYIRNAVLNIYEDGTLKETVPYINGKYQSGVIAQPGKTYRVSVSRQGFTDISAESSLPPFSGTLSSSYIDSVGTDDTGFPLGELTVSFSDDGNSSNYYKLSLYSYNTTIMQFQPMEPESDDPLFLDDNTDRTDEFLTFSDFSFNGRTKTIKFTTKYGSALGTPKYLIKLELLSKEYYEYLQDIRDFEPNTGGIISTEPVLIYSNVNNGLGIFAGTYLATDTIK